MVVGGPAASGPSGAAEAGNPKTLNLKPLKSAGWMGVVRPAASGPNGAAKAGKPKQGDGLQRNPDALQRAVPVL